VSPGATPPIFTGVLAFLSASKLVMPLALVKAAGDVVLSRDADVFEFPRVELNTRFADDLVDHLVAMEIKNG
jgi:hypothetical protein